MKKILLPVAFFIIVTAYVEPANELKVFKQLYNLEGMWLMKTNKGFIGEEWMKMNEHYLQNRGFMVKGDDTIITETVGLRNNNEGIFYTSTVEDQNNKQPVSFKLTSAENNVFVFENPLHNFPKRITYHLLNKDSLHAWIDGGKDNPNKKLSFAYYRVKNKN